MRILFFLLLSVFAFAGKNHAVVVNEIKLAKDAKNGAGLVTVTADVKFNLAPGSFHPHNTALNIEGMVVQAKQLPDNSWQMYQIGQSCLGAIAIGEQLRIRGEINKKIHIYCVKTKVSD